jgi:hypothetical protein
MRRQDSSEMSGISSRWEQESLVPELKDDCKCVIRTVVQRDFILVVYSFAL